MTAEPLSARAARYADHSDQWYRRARRAGRTDDQQIMAGWAADWTALADLAEAAEAAWRVGRDQELADALDRLAARLEVPGD